MVLHLVGVVDMAEKPYKFDFKRLARLAEELVKHGLITKDQLAVVQTTQKNRGGDVGHILIGRGFISREKLLDFIVKELQIETGSIKDYTMDPGVIKLVPHSMASKFSLIPLTMRGELLTVAMSDPLYLFAVDAIRGVVKCDVRPVIVPQEEIDAALASHYRRGTAGEMAGEAMEVVNYTSDADADTSEKLEELASGAKVIAAVNSIIFEAYNDNASDVHIEPMQNRLRVRYRIDGILEEGVLLPKNMHLPIVSRMKIVGGMDIAERRVPQDGRVRVRLKGENLDLRLSTYPTMFGEKLVMRLLPKEKIMTLEDLGFSREEKDRFTGIISRPYGILLVTGPTGSGKTTTLYAALQKVNSQERNIVSIEDPIENEIPGVNQAQVNIKAGMTFASALRSILRQDPDVIMLGEVRDGETANIAFRSAMTGHFVFSTLHTNTAIGAVARLKDLGVEPFLISSGLLGLMAQRLVRKICPHCREKFEIDAAELAKILGRELKDVALYKGRGCKECRMSGYLGRTGIFELINIDDHLKGMIIRGESEEVMKKYNAERGILEIREAGIQKIIDGITTIEEVLRVTEED